MALDYIDPVIDNFFNYFSGNIGLGVVAVIVFIGLLLFFARQEPFFIVLFLTPVLLQLSSYAFGIPSWIVVAISIFIGVGYVLYFARDLIS